MNAFLFFFASSIRISVVTDISLDAIVGLRGRSQDARTTLLRGTEQFPRCADRRQRTLGPVLTAYQSQALGRSDQS
jgi:hypothetical protein